jgi:uncharacterized protein (DUF1330 family)
MAAYVISEVDVRDSSGFETYRSMAAPTIAQYGGRYLVRGGEAMLAEGDAEPKNIIVVEFPSMERLREWYASPEGAAAEGAPDRAPSPSDLCRGRDPHQPSSTILPREVPDSNSACARLRLAALMVPKV